MGIKHTKVAGGVDNPAYDVSKGEWNDDHDISTLDILDIETAETDDSLVLAPDGAGGVEFRAEAGSGGGGVTDADYLVGTSHAGLSAEIVVGTSPGGELGGSWASPTVDATHSGSAHHDAVTVGTGLDVTGQLVELDLSEVAAGGELGGFMDAPTVDSTHSGSTHAGAAAAAVTTHEGASDPHTGYLKESVVSGLAAPGLTLGTTNTAGVALTAIATDATILAFDGTGPAAVGTQAVGAATVAARRDHVHATGAGTPSTQAIGDSAATGSGPAASMTDHKHAMPAFGTGPAAVGTQANGSSANIARIDHVHATGAGTPSTQAFGDAAATGTGPAASMTDHKHAMPAAPTTIANDTIWAAAGDLVRATGNDAASVLSIGAAGGYLSVVNGALAWNSGTSFPASKLTGDRYWRTDLGLEAFWDGTRWVTTTLYVGTLTNGTVALAATGSYGRFGVLRTSWGMYLDTFYATYYVSGTNDSGKYWTLDLSWTDSANASTQLATVSSAAESGSTWYNESAALGVVLDANARVIQGVATKTSTPGNVHALCLFTYRIILT